MEIHNHKKEAMQAAKVGLIGCAGLIILLIVASSSKNVLELYPTYNRGGYTFDRHKSTRLQRQDSAVVTGSIRDIDNQEILIGSNVVLGCIKKNVSDSLYYIKTDSLRFGTSVIATSVGYLTVETKPLTMQAGDSVVINFYLIQDEKQLINCEGVEMLR